MKTRTLLTSSFQASLPIILGYLAIGIPCGIMEHQVGISALLAFLISMTFYSGAGQFMVPGMYLSGVPALSIAASVSFVNSRQLLYSAAFAPYFAHAPKRLAFWFSATVTDESFGVNLSKFKTGEWSCLQAAWVNTFCMMSWSIANVIGVLVGSLLSLPVALASFAMTSIFICLLVMQQFSARVIVVVVVSMLGVVVCKLVGLTGPAILLGATAGVCAGLLYSALQVQRKRERA